MKRMWLWLRIWWHGGICWKCGADKVGSLPGEAYCSDCEHRSWVRRIKHGNDLRNELLATKEAPCPKK